MKENEGIIKIKDRLDIIIFEVTKYWRESGIRKYALIDEVGRIASIILPDRKGHETIRKRIDKLVKEGVLIREGSYKNAIIKVSPNAIIDEIAKPFAEEVRKKIKLQREEKSIIDELRVKHTEKIKERIIRPWIDVLEYKQLEFRRYNLTFEEMKSDPLYKDLENHLPKDLEDPRTIADCIEKKQYEFEKLKEKLTKDLRNILSEIFRERKLKVRVRDTGWSVGGLANVIIDFITWGSFDYFLNFEDVLKRIEVKTIDVLRKKIYRFKFTEPILYVEELNRKVSNKQVARTIYEIFSDDRVKKFVKENEKSLKTIFDEIHEDKKKLIQILKELEAYEILPGVCKYLRGE